MSVNDVFECASVTLAACRAVLRRLTPDDLGRASPCAEFTVGEVGEHVVRSMVLLGSVAAAAPAVAVPAVAVPAVADSAVAVPAVADSAVAVPAVADSGSGSLDERVAAATEAALEAWRWRGLGGSVAVGRSTLAAELAVEIIPLELLVHGWDVAQATGAQIEVAPEVASYVLEQARSLITADKRGRSFAAEVPAGPSATMLEELIAFTGRDPARRSSR
jgi:uncharacterized protein (TIGR03086 family)